MANDLAELAQLLQLSNLSQQPQLEQQRLQQQNHVANVASMLQLLGLQQQGENQQAQQGFNRDQLAQQGRAEQDRTGIEQGRLNQEGAHYGALEALQKLGLTNESQYHQNQLDFEKSKLAQDTVHQGMQDTQAQANNKKAIDLETLKTVAQLTQGGQKLPPAFEAYARAVNPDIGGALDQMHSDAAVQQYNQQKDPFAKVYQGGNPAAISAALIGVEPQAQQWLTQDAQSRPTPAPTPSFWNSFGGASSTPTPQQYGPPAPGQVQQPQTTTNAPWWSQHYDAQGTPVPPPQFDWHNLFKTDPNYIGLSNLPMKQQ